LISLVGNLSICFDNSGFFVKDNLNIGLRLFALAFKVSHLSAKTGYWRRFAIAGIQLSPFAAGSNQNLAG